MIKVWVLGGLGNQLFQYALFYYLNSQGKKVCLDTDDFLNYKRHNGFELYNAFNLVTSICEHNKSNRVKIYLTKLSSVINSKFNGLLISKFNIQINLFKRVFEYKTTHKNSKLFDLSDVKLIGYWQKESYLKLIRKDLQDHLTFNIKTDLTELITMLKKDNVVVIHVRGGDYINLGWELDETYYNAAIERFSQKPNTKYFIITDDKSRLEQLSLNFKYELIDDFNGHQSYINMYLISIARNIVLSNSTFAWWGAYLNSDYNKVVVPRIWLPISGYERIYYPEEWIIV
jgi:hypothetical protein